MTVSHVIMVTGLAIWCAGLSLVMFGDVTLVEAVLFGGIGSFVAGVGYFHKAEEAKDASQG